MARVSERWPVQLRPWIALFIGKGFMKYGIALLFCLFTLGSSSGTGQTAKDTSAKYGGRENVYSVSEHIWMTPTYGDNDQVCMMRLYPKLVSSDTNYLADKLDLDEALKFIGQLLPIETRGARKDLFGMSDLGGGVIWTSFNYDQVRFVFISTFKLDKDPKRQLNEANVGLDFPIDKAAVAESRRKEGLETDDALMRKYASNPKMLEIYWANRKCVAP
jgi:hypothetical protein